jgi:hypothetical protein
MYTPEVAAFSDEPVLEPPVTGPNALYEQRQTSLPPLPPDIGSEDRGFANDLSDALPAVDPFASPNNVRSRSATTSKPKKSGMLSFINGMSLAEMRRFLVAL